MKEKLIVVGDHEPNTIAQMQTAVSDDRVHAGALLADGHKGYQVAIGGVLVSREHFAFATVGFDIACGMKAVKTNIKRSDVKDVSSIMDEVMRRISFGVGRANNTKVDHALFDDERWSMKVFQDLKDLARNQLGTVGGGNHFVSFNADEDDNIWICCHFGSRGLGHKTATWFIQQTGSSDNMDVAPMLLHEKSAIGEEYIQAIDLAGKYAYAGRDWVCNEMANILQAQIIDEVHLHHNFLWKEMHNGEEFWVGRKGATPAQPGQRGMVGASMCEPCVIVEGIESDLSRQLYYSTVHGAGRVMSRTQASGRSKWGKKKYEPAVTDAMMQDWVKKAGIELRGGDVDESPQVYRRLSEVISKHEGTIRVVHTLTPIGVAMAPRNTRDPYKD